MDLYLGKEKGAVYRFVSSLHMKVTRLNVFGDSKHTQWDEPGTVAHLIGNMYFPILAPFVESTVLNGTFLAALIQRLAYCITHLAIEQVVLHRKVMRIY